MNQNAEKFQELLGQAVEKYPDATIKVYETGEVTSIGISEEDGEKVIVLHTE